jgi:DUF1009 family protein
MTSQIPEVPEDLSRLGLIAGNGQLPFLVLEEASRQGIPVTVAAIKEETESGIEDLCSDLPGEISLHWLGLGQLGRMIKVFHQEKVNKIIMVGQVKHVRIFAPGSRSPLKQLKHLPDLRMIQMLASLRKKDTGTLLGAVTQTLESEGFEVLDSRILLKTLLPDQGVLTSRIPSKDENRDFEYGRKVAKELTRLDLGQTLVVKNQAVVAIEAMEGTDETIRRASKLVDGEPLTVIKSSRPNQEMRFDVPVIGIDTLSVLEECNVKALGVDAGKTLILDKDRFLMEASRLGISVVGF